MKYATIETLSFDEHYQHFMMLCMQGIIDDVPFEQVFKNVETVESLDQRKPTQYTPQTVAALAAFVIYSFFPKPEDSKQVVRLLETVSKMEHGVFERGSF